MFGINSSFDNTIRESRKKEKKNPYLDNPSCERQAVDLHFYYDGVLAMLDLSSDPPYHGDSTDYPLLQKNVVDKRMNGTDRN